MKYFISLIDGNSRSWMRIGLVLWMSIFSFMARAIWDEETPVMMTDMDPLRAQADDRLWSPPDYSQQKTALGYRADLFSIPPAMKPRVSFWMDIYTKYSTDQGVIHDSQYVHLVYESVDFTDIMKQDELNMHQKARARKKRVDEAKKRIRERLHRLQQLKNSEGLEGEDLRYWQLFSPVEGEKKFSEAAREGRLRFQLGQRDRFEQGIHYSGKYLEEMEAIFREENVPIELTRLPFVESSFNIKARSRVGASGVWQFMRYTGRQYLKMNTWVDERNDPLIATRAAARLLRYNYNFLESWPLAITAYNHGPAGIKRLTQKFNTTDIVELIDVRKGRFGFASANFYASFLAALEVEKNANNFFSTPLWMPSLRSEIIVLDRSLLMQDLISAFDGNEDRAREFNPHILPFVWSSKRALGVKTKVRVPLGESETILALWKNKKKLAERSPTLAPPMRSVSQEKSSSYRVERGDTLSDIARQFGVSVQDLLLVNDISNPRALRAGEKIIIPEK